MPIPRHLREAPITEAIIDFRVKARSGFDPKEFNGLKPELLGRFPRLDEARVGTVTFQLAPTGATPPVVEDRGLQGLVFHSADERLLVQFRTDGFTLNRLKPYTSWAELFPMALELWNRYVSVATPEAVVRLATRCINHIPLPPDMRDFEQYLRAAPQIPPELPQSVSAFFTRVTIHEGQLAAHIVQALQTDVASRRITVILDIDAFCDGSWNSADPDVGNVLGHLHELRNRIFFNAVTDETLRQFG